MGALSTVPSLRSVDLSFNELTRLDGEALACLPDLRLLAVANNRLEAVAGLDRCKKLETLLIQNNCLAQLGGLHEARFLRGLRADGNALTALDGALSKAFSLVDLDVSRNLLVSTVGLKEAVKLVTLNLAHNRLTALGALPATLTDLDASHNRIASLPGLAALTSLRVLDLSHNALMSWAGFAGLPALCELYLAGNRLGSLPPALAEWMPALEVLDVSDNNLFCGMRGHERGRALLAEALAPLAACSSLCELDLRGNTTEDGLQWTAADITRALLGSRQGGAAGNLELVNGEPLSAAEVVVEAEEVGGAPRRRAVPVLTAPGRPLTASGRPSTSSGRHAGEDDMSPSKRSPQMPLSSAPRSLGAAETAAVSVAWSTAGLDLASDTASARDAIAKCRAQMRATVASAVAAGSAPVVDEAAAEDAKPRAVNNKYKAAGAARRASGLAGAGLSAGAKSAAAEGVGHDPPPPQPTEDVAVVPVAVGSAAALVRGRRTAALVVKTADY